MCGDCHDKLHRRGEFLPHLTPKISRREAESKGLVSKIGLAETQYKPYENPRSTEDVVDEAFRDASV